MSALPPLIRAREKNTRDLQGDVRKTYAASVVQFLHKIFRAYIIGHVCCVCVNIWSDFFLSFFVQQYLCCIFIKIIMIV